MRPRSSTSSSETAGASPSAPGPPERRPPGSGLRPRFPRPGRAALLALALLICAEAGVRVLLRTGALRADPTLDDLVEANLVDLVHREPEVWLLGNSVLESGIDGDVLERTTGRTVAKLVHGSATVLGSAEMLDYYLARVRSSPRRILVLLSLDDLNPNGGRARVSENYVDYAAGSHGSPLRVCALFRARGNLGRAILAGLIRLAGGAGAVPGEPDANEGSERPGSSVPAPERNLPWLRSAAADFDVDRRAFRRLSEIAADRSLPPPEVVLLPATDWYFGFHETCAPAWPLDRIRREVAATCRRNHLPFLDLSGLLGAQEYYLDSYHLNSRGAVELTARIASRLK